MKLFLHLIIYNISDTLHLYVAVYLPLQIIVADSRRQSKDHEKRFCVGYFSILRDYFHPSRIGQ